MAEQVHKTAAQRQAFTSAFDLHFATIVIAMAKLLDLLQVDDGRAVDLQKLRRVQFIGQLADCWSKIFAVNPPLARRGAGTRA